MSRTNLAKVELYRVMVLTAISLIEERTGNKMDVIDASLERRVDNAIAYKDIKALKALHTELDELYTRVKKRALIA